MGGASFCLRRFINYLRLAHSLGLHWQYNTCTVIRETQKKAESQASGCHSALDLITYNLHDTTNAPCLRRFRVNSTHTYQGLTTGYASD